MLRNFIIFTFFIFINLGDIHAGEIYLKNGDHISGKIIEETETATIIET